MQGSLLEEVLAEKKMVTGGSFGSLNFKWILLAPICQKIHMKHLSGATTAARRTSGCSKECFNLIKECFNIELKLSAAKDCYAASVEYTPSLVVKCSLTLKWCKWGPKIYLFS